MVIDDIYIKSKILHYQQTREGFPSITEHLSLAMYYFPKLINPHCSVDIYGEYYEYLLVRLERIILSYEPLPKVLFKTWFFVVQRMHYLNFVQMCKRKDAKMQEKYFSSFDLEAYIGDEPISWKDHLDSFNHLDTNERVFAKLFSPENLNRLDFLYLMKELQCDLATLSHRIRILFDVPQGDRNLIKVTSVQRVAQFLEWSHSKVARKLNLIRDKMKQNYIWED